MQSAEAETSNSTTEKQQDHAEDDDLVWTHSDTLLLIDTYRKYRPKLQDRTKKKDIWELVASAMNEVQNSNKFTGRKCNKKWNNLELRYKRKRDKTKKTGRGGGKQWPYFELIDDIVGSAASAASVPVDKALMIALWTLATPDSYRAIANLFDVPESTVLLCLRRVCSATIRTSCQNFIKLLNSKDDYERNEERFANICGMRNILGAIDGCHIAIKAPVHEPSAHVNRKGFYSVLLQAVVDSQLMFMDCYAG